MQCGDDNKLHHISLTNFEESTISDYFSGITHPIISLCNKYVAFIGELDNKCNLYLIDIEGKNSPLILAENAWYIINPNFSPNHKQITWQEWKKDTMPWYESQIHIASFEKDLNQISVSEFREIKIKEKHQIFKKNTNYSYPTFSPKGNKLAFISDDHSNWRNIWISDPFGTNYQAISLIPKMEIGKLEWISGLRAIQWINEDELLA